MRAMGPGSVSSILKTALDVAYVVTLIVVAALLVAALLALILPPDQVVWRSIDLEGPAGDLLGTGGSLALVLFLTSVYVALFALVMNRLRRVFATLSAGEPFDPQNVGRLQSAGFALAVIALADSFKPAGRLLFSDPGAGASFTLDITAWFAVLVVFVLAEVFREGARLRREAELTI